VNTEEKEVSKTKKYKLFYAFSFILLILFGVVDYLNWNIFIKKILAISFIAILLMATILHLYDIFNKLWSHKFVKFGFAIFIAYIGLYTDSISHFTVYRYVHENPDNFSVAVNFLDAIHIYPNLLLFIVLLIILISFFSIIILLFRTFFEIKLIDKGISYFIPSFILSFILLMLYIGFYNKIEIAFTNLDKKAILLSSYYPNMTCQNKELKNMYIKLIGVNGKVSYSNIKTTEVYNYTPIDLIKNMLFFNKEIYFKTTVCQKNSIPQSSTSN